MNYDYAEKYRGFEIVGIKNDSIERYNYGEHMLEKVGGIDYVVYAIEDKKHERKLFDTNFAIGYELKDYNMDSFDRAAHEFVDKNIGMLQCVRKEAAKQRKNSQLANAIAWIVEAADANSSSEELFTILTESIGMTYIDILEAGYSNLIPCFDREKYAEIIADAIVEEGTTNTSTGNWHIDFCEIKDKFAVDLDEDEDLLELVKSALYDNYGDAIAEMDIYDSQFDIMYFLFWCPDAE